MKNVVVWVIFKTCIYQWLVCIPSNALKKSHYILIALGVGEDVVIYKGIGTTDKKLTVSADSLSGKGVHK